MEHLNEKCGVFGVYIDEETTKKDLETILKNVFNLNRRELSENILDEEIISSGTNYVAAIMTYVGLSHLQHRGQESAGISASDRNEIKILKQMGLVKDAITSCEFYNLGGYNATGHTRYSTTGTSTLDNAQPIHIDTKKYGTLTISHNGNIVNEVAIRKDLQQKGIRFKGTTDTELILHLIDQSKSETLEEAVEDTISQINGSYSALIHSKDEIIGIRDPHGFRPLYKGDLKKRFSRKKLGYIIGSEPIALNSVGGVNIREVKPGEMVIFNSNGAYSKIFSKQDKLSQCSFELIYLSLGKSKEHKKNYVFDKDIVSFKLRTGKAVYSEHKKILEGYDKKELIVVPIKGSGYYPAQGFAKISGLAFGDGIIEKRYKIQRSFIKPTDEERKKVADFTVDAKRISDKIVICIEDSVVRGTTSEILIKKLKEAGAKKVIWLNASPPYISPCFYGVATPTKKELIMANKTLEETRQYIGADYLGYLSMKSLAECILYSEPHAKLRRLAQKGYDKLKQNKHLDFLKNKVLQWVLPDNSLLENLLMKEFCVACFNEKYPTDIPEYVHEKYLVL